MSCSVLSKREWQVNNVKHDSIFPIVIHAILAFLGGCTREISIMDQKGFKVYSFISGAFVSTFGGVVIFFLCMNYEVQPWLTAALTSLAGYIGIPILDTLTIIVKTKLETVIDIKDKE